MAMREGTYRRLLAVSEKLGDVVENSKITELEENGGLPRGSSVAVINYGERVDRGKYDISEAIKNNASRFGDVELEEVEDDGVEPEYKDDNLTQNLVDPEENDLNVPKKDPYYVEDKSGCYGVLLEVLSSNIFCPTYISGESGNGKTMAVEQACAKNNKPLLIFNVTNETTEEDLIGHYILEDGNLAWRDGPVLKAYRTGSVLCLDEIDQGTSRLMCLQTILQQKPYFVKKTGETVFPAKGFMVVATGNTVGKGDEQDKFVGAQILNEAFLERFPITVHQSYPTKAVERRILKKIIKGNDSLIERLIEWASTSRKAAEDGVEGHITTRRLVQIANMMSIFQDPEKAIEYATNRFGEETRSALVKTFKATK